MIGVLAESSDDGASAFLAGGMAKYPVDRFSSTGSFANLAASAAVRGTYATTCAVALILPRRSTREPVQAPVVRMVRSASRVVSSFRTTPETFVDTFPSPWVSFGGDDEAEKRSSLTFARLKTMREDPKAVIRAMTVRMAPSALAQPEVRLM